MVNNWVSSGSETWMVCTSSTSANEDDVSISMVCVCLVSRISIRCTLQLLLAWLGMPL